MTYLAKPKKRKKKSKKVPKELYDKVYNRDNGQCVLCGYGGEEVQLHHIHYGDHLRVHEEDNCVMLCEECHRTSHGRKKFFIEMLERYIEYTKKINNL